MPAWAASVSSWLSGMARARLWFTAPPAVGRTVIIGQDGRGFHNRRHTNHVNLMFTTGPRPMTTTM
jgi:hypothetical protein